VEREGGGHLLKKTTRSLTTLHGHKKAPLRGNGRKGEKGGGKGGTPMEIRGFVRNITVPKGWEKKKKEDGMKEGKKNRPVSHESGEEEKNRKTGGRGRVRNEGLTQEL